MSDNLAAIERLTREHQQALGRIGGIHKAVLDLTGLRQNWVPGRPPELQEKLAQLRQQLDTIKGELQDHMRFEEHEFLPVLARYAADIIRRGLLFEHGHILDSIDKAAKEAGELDGEPADRTEMLTRELRIRELLDGILELMQQHAITQETIFTLARGVLAEERDAGRRR